MTDLYNLHPPTKRAGWVKLALLIVVLGTLLLLQPKNAAAHTEGIMQLAAEPAGPYKLTVWTSPDPASTGEPLHVAIAAVTAEDALPLLEADILVTLTPDDGGPAITESATTENSENKFLHEAILEVDDDGGYLVEITVQGGDGGSGQVSFPLTVESQAGTNWTLIVVAFLVVGAAVVLIGRYRRKPELVAEDKVAETQ
jgi:hypothetical protein